MSVELCLLPTETIEHMLKHESEQYWKASDKATVIGKLCDDYWDELKRREKEDAA